LIPLARAQSTTQAAAAQEEELKRARIARDKKALAAVEEIIKEVQSLKLPENRIRVQIALADQLWERDEQRARSLFNAAAGSLGEIAADMAAKDPAYYDAEDPGSYNLSDLALQMRREMLQIVAKHDGRLALDFLRNTRPAAPQAGYGQPNLEAQLEMSLAAEVAGKDASEALRIAEESLKKGIDYQALNLLYRLHSSDKGVAEKLLASILDRLRTEDFTKNPGSWHLALTLLRTWSENNRAPQQETRRTTFDIRLVKLDEQAARDLSAGIIGAVMNDGLGGSPQLQLFSGQHFDNLQQIKMLMPDMERLSPNQAMALRKRIAGFDKINELQQGPWGKYQELIQNGTPVDLIEAAKTAPPGIADHLTQQAASKAFSQGDTDTARQIAGRIENPRQRNEATLNIDRQLVQRAAEQGSLADARALISRIPAIEERAGLLVQWASGAAGRGDRSTAIQLLGEAMALLGERSHNYQQLRAHLEIARAYEQLDINKSASIVETTIDQFNVLAAAALILNGFDLHQYFREGEFIISSNNMMGMVAQEMAGQLRSLALQDFDRAIAATARFQRGEMRAMALLQIVQGSLTSGSPDDTEGR
jgi:hypothetical protein